MKSRLITSFVLVGIAVSGSADAGLFSKKEESMPKELAVRTTAYTHTEADHIEYGKKNAAGTKLQYGKNYSSAAADWSKFPLGTKFKIDGMNTTFVVDDYGSALVGTETIDIYKPSRSAMNQWGVRNVDIKILEYGDFEKSREILEQRTKYSHVRKMLAGIKKDPGPDKQKSTTFAKKDPIPAPVTLPTPIKEEAPKLQLAAASPAPHPKSVPTPAPAPTKPKPESTPAPAPVSTPAAPPVLTKPSVQLAAVTPTPTPAPEPAKVPAAAAAAAPPTRNFRVVQPLQVASASVAATPSVNEPVAAPHPAEAKPAPATAPANSRKVREFRPLLVASVNG